MIEVYLFNFDGDLYGEEIEVEFMAEFRPDATFATGTSSRSRCVRTSERLKRFS